MSEPKQQLNYGPITKEMARFYQALGTFNTNMVATIVKDPAKVKEVTDFIIVHCTTHAQQCGSGNIWDEYNHICTRPGDPPIGIGPEG